MGVFTVGRQVALEIDMPGWWLANASVDMDFRRGLYYDSSTPNPRTATDFLSCTRASVGYAKTATGTLTSFASNALRITDLGLLVEDARTNICKDSGDQTTANWGVINVTMTANQATGPDGNVNMDTIDDGTANDRHLVYQQITISANTPYTVSVFVKDNNRRYARLSWLQVNSLECIVDLQTGLITQSGICPSGSNAGQVFTSASVEAFGNGIYRLSLTGIIDNFNTLAFLTVQGLDTGTPTAPSYASGSPTYTGSNKQIYVWGAQCEQASFVSSYVVTTGAATTRAAENITTSGSLQTAINVATGSLVAQVDNGSVASVAANVVDSNGTNLLGFDASNHGLASMIGTLATGNTANRTTQDKLGLAWNASGRSLVLNGGTVATDASAQTPSATQHVGSSGTTNFAYAYIERLSAWTTKLADATLQGFTV